MAGEITNFPEENAENKSFNLEFWVDYVDSIRFLYIASAVEYLRKPTDKKRKEYIANQNKLRESFWEMIENIEFAEIPDENKKSIMTGLLKKEDGDVVDELNEITGKKNKKVTFQPKILLEGLDYDKDDIVLDDEFVDADVEAEIDEIADSIKRTFENSLDGHTDLFIKHVSNSHLGKLINMAPKVRRTSLRITELAGAVALGIYISNKLEK